MSIKNIVITGVVLFTSCLFLQENLYTSASIPSNLTQNANAVVRLHEINISVNDINSMDVSEKRIITILNKQGDQNVDAFVHYDKNVKIKELEAVVFNQFGKEIKK